MAEEPYPIEEEISVPNPVDAYISRDSVTLGDNIPFHINATSSANYDLEIFELYPGDPATPILSYSVHAEPELTKATAYKDGCQWHIRFTLRTTYIGHSGVFSAKIFYNSQDHAAGYAEVIFVVKEVTPGSYGKILVKISLNTYQAYNTSGGDKSLYSAGVYKVSLNRPQAMGSSFYNFYDYPLING